MKARTWLAGAAAAAVAIGGAGPASAADGIPGDEAILNTPGFELNPDYLEPGVFPLDKDGILALVGDSELSNIADHVDVTQKGNEIHVTVAPGANFSVDQVLVPGANGGYNVVNGFDTGTSANDPDVDPGQTATDLVPPAGLTLPLTLDLIERATMVAVSDHPDGDQNEPYEQAPNHEVAAKNRPVIQPKVAALGVSAIEPLNTYKVGFGYSVPTWYDEHWRTLFNTDMEDLLLLDWWGDPQAFDIDANTLLDAVNVLPGAKQPGVARVNDIDEFGEEFSNLPAPKADYGQTVLFGQEGDPYAFLHDSLGIMLGGIFVPLADFELPEIGLPEIVENVVVDETAVTNLLSFTTQGDLPIAWTLKSSLAPQRYTRSVSLTDDQVRAWEAAWQAYYAGKGPKPTLPLAPGTNSPAPAPGIVINLPETASSAPPVSVPASKPATPATPATPAVPTPVVQKQQPVQAVPVSNKIVTIKLRRNLRRGKITYLSAHGVRTASAKRSGRRLFATADLRGMPMSNKIWAVRVDGVTKTGKKVTYTKLVQL